MYTTPFLSAASFVCPVVAAIDRSPLTAPIRLYGIGHDPVARVEHIAKAGLSPNVFLRLAEVGLVLLLFTDASRTDLRLLVASPHCRDDC